MNSLPLPISLQKAIIFNHPDYDGQKIPSATPTFGPMVTTYFFRKEVLADQFSEDKAVDKDAHQKCACNNCEVGAKGMIKNSLQFIFPEYGKVRK